MLGLLQTTENETPFWQQSSAHPRKGHVYDFIWERGSLRLSNTQTIQLNQTSKWRISNIIGYALDTLCSVSFYCFPFWPHSMGQVNSVHLSRSKTGILLSFYNANVQ